MPNIKIENFQLHYETKGTGEPLVLIPGFASGAWLWFKQIDFLAKHFQIITFDPRGVANSKISDDSTLTISIKTIAEDIAELLTELRIEKANILGTSFGGFVAQEFVLQHPTKLNKLLLACTSFGGINHVLPNTEVLKAFSSTEGLNSPKRIRRYLEPAFTKDFLDNHSEIIDEVCRLREENIVPETVYLQQLYSATGFDTESRIPQINAETLIITGDKDTVVPMQNSINLANSIPNSKLEIIKDGGHLFFIEQAEKFNQIVKDFLSK